MAPDFRIGQVEARRQFANLKRVAGRQHHRVALSFSSRIMGLKKGTCGVLSKSIQIFISNLFSDIPAAATARADFVPVNSHRCD